MNKLHVVMSPITGNIYAGSVCKDGVMWKANHTDVTGQAGAAVAQRVLEFHRGTTLVTANGEPAWEITVTKLPLPAADPSVAVEAGSGD